MQSNMIDSSFTIQHKFLFLFLSFFLSSSSSPLPTAGYSPSQLDNNLTTNFENHVSIDCSLLPDVPITTSTAIFLLSCHCHRLSTLLLHSVHSNYVVHHYTSFPCVSHSVANMSHPYHYLRSQHQVQCLMSSPLLDYYHLWSPWPSSPSFHLA